MASLYRSYKARQSAKKETARQRIEDDKQRKEELEELRATAAAKRDLEIKEERLKAKLERERKWEEGIKQQNYEARMERERERTNKCNRRK